jgi:hypothetical protein
MTEEEIAALNDEGTGEPSALIRPLEMDLGKISPLLCAWNMFV